MVNDRSRLSPSATIPKSRVVALRLQIGSGVEPETVTEAQIEDPVASEALATPEATGVNRTKKVPVALATSEYPGLPRMTNRSSGDVTVPESVPAPVFVIVKERSALSPRCTEPKSSEVLLRLQSGVP
jgi:hypothetical protein